jgi:hypothetical protein
VGSHDADITATVKMHQNIGLALTAAFMDCNRPIATAAEFKGTPPLLYASTRND